MTGDVRRRAVREKYGRRGRSGDPEDGSRACWHATWSTSPRPGSPGSRTPWVLTGTARRSWPPGSPRRNSATCRTCAPASPGPPPCERDVRGRLAAFYDWCAQHDDISRAAHPGPHGLPVGGADRRGDPYGSDERSGFTLHLMLMIRCLVWRSGVLCLAELMMARGSDSFLGRG